MYVLTVYVVYDWYEPIDLSHCHEDSIHSE